MPSTARRALLVGAPLAFAALLMLHPTGGSDFAVLVSENLTAWLAVHYGAAVLFPLMGYLLWVLIADLPGRAATVARYAIPVYAVLYGVYEAMVGLATGLATQEGGDRVAGAVNGIATHPIVGEGGVLPTAGGLAWIVAVTGAILALRAAGVRTSALVLLGIGTLMILHIPPIGPVALACFAGAAVMIVRRPRPAAILAT
jgi:hypothetical protein